MAISRNRIPFSMGYDLIPSAGPWLKTISKDLSSLADRLSREGKTIWHIAMAISKNKIWFSRKPPGYHVIRHRMKTTAKDRFSRSSGPLEKGKLLPWMSMALHQKRNAFQGSDAGFIMKE